MSKDASILVYGSDEQLLQTRKWVLEASGYRVWTAIELAEVERILSANSLDLMIFCHSLTPEAYERALASVLAKRPGVHVLAMASAGLGSPRGPEAEELEPLAGPAKLVAAVDKIIRCPNPPAAASLSS